jgi:osmoprotectant transport system substrate-binding protein
MNAVRKIFAGALCVATLASMAACGGSSDPLGSDKSSAGGSGSAIVIGSADFAESQLVATIYSHALKKAGVDVKEKLNIGSREVYMDALKDGSIDLIPEYSGTLLSYLDKSSSETDPGKIVDALNVKLPDGIVALNASEAEDTDVIAVTKKFSEGNGVTKISDLKKIESQVVLGGPSEWKERYVGVPGLEKVYGLKFKDFQVLDAGGPLTLSALRGGQVQAGDMFSSDPSIEDSGLVALKDDKQLFAPAQVLPIVRKSKLTDKGKEALNKVSAKLTTDGLISMNRKVNAGDDIGKVADGWLSQQGL